VTAVIVTALVRSRELRGVGHKPMTVNGSKSEELGLSKCLPGCGPTRFLDKATPRSGEQAAIGADLLALIDALGVKHAVYAGYDWGGRAACVAAALWPDRCTGLVSVNSYLIQDIAKAMVPVKPEREVPLWYQYYFQLERGRAGLAANRREIAKILWRQWSPNWHFDEATVNKHRSGAPGYMRATPLI
jgi:pimeloyl-ACP methyl ester carboxylesterase